MAKKKIAILGGGMAGLATAYELSRTPELQAAYDVTVYQMGWRLGGKAASGRDALGRNLEHGLHVWFGCYANVFRMIREVYAVWNKPAGCPLQEWTDVAKPQPFTPIGVRTEHSWTYFPLVWPTNEGVPGIGGLDLTPHEVLTTLSNLFLIVIRDIVGDLEGVWGSAKHVAPQPAVTLATPLPAAFAAATGIVEHAIGDEIARARQLFARSRFNVLSFEDKVEAAVLWTKSLVGTDAARDPQHVEQIIALHADARTSFEAAAAGVPSTAARAGSTLAIKLQLVHELFDVFLAAFRGYYADLVVPDQPFESLDALDFREWLLKHGAKPEIVATSSVVRILYDTMFQYGGGDVAQPSYAAGSALGVIARLIGTYKGSMMWDIQAGMGEAVITPLYEVLRDHGVKFKFFRKVERLELASDGHSIARIHLARQADVKTGDYVPTFLEPTMKLVCWPSEPDWDQLVDGAALRAAKINFESHWCPRPPVGEEVLNGGTQDDPAADFHTVVLAITMGAYKPLNAEPGMCDELIAANAGFADFVHKMGLVPSQGLQLWSDWTLPQLGWTAPKAALVSGPEYLNIWADMSQVLAFESWGAVKPKSLHYLTGTYKTELYKEPSTNVGVPAAAQAELRTQALDWINTLSFLIFPSACDGQRFDYAALTDVGNGTGVARFDAQYLRANVDPHECCVASAAGTTRYRLLPDQSGFDNLVLAGEATRHGFNTTTIEGATMSGMAAARAICGEPAVIVGYDFLRVKPSQRTQ